MNREWIKIVVAAMFEVGWGIGLKHANNIVEWVLTVVAIVVSFYLLIKATQKLAVGTAYAVFVGLGTTGTVLMDTLLFGANLSSIKLFFIGLLLFGVISLKLVSDNKKGAH